MYGKNLSNVYFKEHLAMYTAYSIKTLLAQFLLLPLLQAHLLFGLMIIVKCSPKYLQQFTTSITSFPYRHISFAPKKRLPS